MAFVAQGYLAYDLSDSASVLGLIYGAQAVPMLLLPLFAGVAADRFGRRGIIQEFRNAAKQTSINQREHGR